MPQQFESKNNPFARGPWHDRFFKSHFGTPEEIKSLLKLALTPSQLKLFDLNTIMVKKSGLPDSAELQEHLSDLVAEIQLKSGDQVVIGIVIEHKSGQDRKLMRQLLVYMARLYDKDTLAVLPITIYHGRSKWRLEKSFHAFEHARLPRSFLTAFRAYLIDFRTVFVNLRDDPVRQRLTELPTKERLALQAMADIWEADADTFASWLMESGSLPKETRRETIRSVHNYFAHVHQSITILQIQRAMQTKHSGAKTMQDKQHVAEILKEWNGVLPESYGEAHSQGVARGRIEGKEEATYKFAERLIQDGMPDSDIRRYTQLSLKEISKLRNGG